MVVELRDQRLPLVCALVCHLGRICRCPLDYPSVYTRWASLYALPLMIGAAHFWLVRKGFYFTAAGCELPIVWTMMLIVQALLGDGPYVVKVPALPWERARQPHALQS